MVEIRNNYNISTVGQNESVNLLLADNHDPSGTVQIADVKNLGIEIRSFSIPYHAKKNPSAIRHHLHELRNIKLLALHAPYGDLCPGSSDPDIAQITKLRYLEAISIGRVLGVQHYIFHNGYVPGTSYVERWIKRAREFWLEFMGYIRDDEKCYLENMLEPDPSIIYAVIDGINDPRLLACLDIGHAHCFSNIPVAKWIETLNKKIGYVHLHDNDGKSDQHLGLGQGNIPLIEVCTALLDECQGALWTLEPKNGEFQLSLEWLAKYKFWAE